MTANKVPWRAGLSYGALGLPLAFLALPLYVHLPALYAEQNALQPALPLATLGLVLLVTRLFDAALDPFIGRWIDGLFARRLRLVWQLAAAAAVGVGAGFAALFVVPGLGTQMSGSALMIWLATMLALTYVAFSTLTITHQAFGARLGGSAAQRAQWVAWREGLALLGVLMASVIPSVAGMGASAVVLCATLLLGLLLLMRVPGIGRSSVSINVSGDLMSPATRNAAPSHWSTPWRNASFRKLLGVYMLNGVASAVPATLVLFFVRDRWGSAAWEPVLLGLYFVAALCGVPLGVRATSRWGLSQAWLAAMMVACVAFTFAFTLRSGDVLGFAFVCIATGLALGTELTAPGALLVGVIQRSANGKVDSNNEGVYVGGWTSATKLNLGLAAGLALPLLAWAGYSPGQRDDTALSALSLAYVAVPCLLKLMAAALLWRWQSHIQGDWP